MKISQTFQNAPQSTKVSESEYFAFKGNQDKLIEVNEILKYCFEEAVKEMTNCTILKLGEKALTLDRKLEHAAEEANRNASNQAKAAITGFDLKRMISVS